MNHETRLCQDEDGADARKLSRWFASRPGARARLAAAMNACDVCKRNPERMNSDVSECSHAECPHRRNAWSEQPTPAEMFRGPWGKYTEADPLPLDIETKKAMK